MQKTTKKHVKRLILEDVLDGYIEAEDRGLAPVLPLRNLGVTALPSSCEKLLCCLVRFVL